MKEEKTDERLSFSKFDVKETFLNLTKYNTPYGTESILEPLLPNGIKKDEFGNYYYRVGNKSKTMFTAHLDDASWGSGIDEVNHVINGEMIETDGTTILGADDKAGVTILLYMIHHKVPGTYYFFLGEESGMQGSKGILRIKRNWFSTNFKRCISFDRRGYGSIISRQIGQQCCSNQFVDALKEQYDSLGLKHRNDPGGIFTDSAAFIGVIPECTNISVGYFNEHSHHEQQNIEYLERLSKASIKIKWEELPTVGVKGRRFGRDDTYYYNDYGIW